MFLWHRSCFDRIRDFRRIRRCIPLSVAKTVDTTVVTNRLDYCNSLLYNIAPKDILKVQCVQTCLVVTRSPQFSHSVPLLKSLHWLRVQSRIIFKLYCTIAYHTLSSGKPTYLFVMLSLSLKLRELRSSGFHLLSVPRVKPHAGTRPLSVAVPTLWNSLSERVTSSNSIDSFRYHLKTHFVRLLPTFLFHLIIVDEFCIVHGLWVCPNLVLGGATQLDSFREDIGAVEVL